MRALRSVRVVPVEPQAGGLAPLVDTRDGHTEPAVPRLHNLSDPNPFGPGSYLGSVEEVPCGSPYGRPEPCILPCEGAMSHG